MNTLLIKLSTLTILLTFFVHFFGFSQKFDTDTLRASELVNYAVTLVDNEKYDSAIIYFNKASQLYKKHRIWEDYSSAQNDLGYSYILDDEPDIGLNILKKNVKNIIKRLGVSNNYLAEGYENISLAYYAKGQSSKTLEFLYEALRIRLQTFGEIHSEVAYSYYSIGIYYYYENISDSALFHLKMALNIYNEIYNTSHQDIADTYYTIGNIFFEKSEYDSALYHLDTALKLYEEIFGQNHQNVVNSYYDIGIVYHYKMDYDSALNNFEKALIINKKLYSDNNIDLGNIHYEMGYIYKDKGLYDSALIEFEEALNIYIEIFGEIDQYVAEAYEAIGVILSHKGQFEIALKNHMKALNIYKEIWGDNNEDVARSYYNTGGVYWNKAETDLALEYFMEALTIYKEIFGDIHQDIAGIYNNIGLVYDDIGESVLALDYKLKALDVYNELLSEKSPDIASCYTNIGTTLSDLGDYNSSLEYQKKGLTIYKELFGEKHPDIGRTYYNLGYYHLLKGDYDLAEESLEKAMMIFSELYGEKHPHIAQTYNTIGDVYFEKSNFTVALENYQSAIEANINNTIKGGDNLLDRLITDYFDQFVLLESLWSKAETFENIYFQTRDLKDLTASLQLLTLCDTLIDKIRQTIILKSDKIKLGETSSEIYEVAVRVSIRLFKHTQNERYLHQAFYFSEQNKTSVLIGEIADVHASKYSGIPDSLLEEEKELKTDITFYKKQIAQESDSILELEYRDKLFKLNRKYENLVTQFEQQYPRYYQLKHNIKTATINEIQNLLDSQTATISYFLGDSCAYIFTISDTIFYVKDVKIDSSFTNRINLLRYCLTTPSSTYTEIYIETALYLYSKLLVNSIPSNIKKIIIIPDRELTLIPFEALLVEEYKDDLTDFKNYPFMIKEYDISYTYSANLFYSALTGELDSKEEVLPENDWLGFAPIFKAKSNSAITQQTKRTLLKIDSFHSNSKSLHINLLNGKYITPLPGTEYEVKAIYEEFLKKNLPAKIILSSDAREEFVKSGDLMNYKYLHFATHGWVDSEEPELSGILLAQDTSSNEDGILYFGEIYNLDIQADLTVLSACETGLGKMYKGEGLIGLSVALLYAGTNNVIVSLWKVADKSTSTVMIDFYKNLLEDNKHEFSFSNHLRSAKLKMINEGQYSHPFYWSPFILIGE